MSRIPAARDKPALMRRPSPLPLLALALACTPRPPAELPIAEGEPSGRDDRVFVEREPEANPDAPKPADPRVLELYRCWFESPYEYMFSMSPPVLQAGNTAMGMMMGGINGLLYYGGLAPCATRLLGLSEGGWGDSSALGELAGVSLQNPLVTEFQGDFTAVNPAFIAWARSNLLIHPETYIDGIAARSAYDYVFQRFFRLMVLSAIAVIEQNPSGLDAEARTYLTATRQGTDGLNWLHQRYVNLVPAYPEGWDGTTMTAPMAAGFWLRRQLDGSIGPCWHGAIEVVQLYDPSWLASQRSEHLSAFATLDGLPDTTK